MQALVHRAVAGGRDHQPRDPFVHQRLHSTPVRPGLAVQDLDPRPAVACPGLPKYVMVRSWGWPLTHQLHLTALHEAKRPDVARRKGVESVGMHLAHVCRGMHPASAHRGHAPRARCADNANCIGKVLRTVGREGRCRPHGAGEHHRLASGDHPG
ncbi:MAG: hypothetical protein NVS2B4_00740 [Ramlibacter sp.]